MVVTEKWLQTKISKNIKRTTQKEYIDKLDLSV